MTNSPIIDELHAVREKLLADAGGTLDDLVDRLQAEEQNSERPRYKRPERTSVSGAVEAGESENNFSTRASS